VSGSGEIQRVVFIEGMKREIIEDAEKKFCKMCSVYNLRGVCVRLI
jgi:hypothetical protein